MGIISSDSSQSASQLFSLERESYMINLISTTMIERPVKQVFDFISTAGNDVQWQYGALAASQLTLHPIGLGTLFSSLSYFMGRRLQGKFEVTEYEPNKKYGFRSLAGPIQTQTLYIFEKQLAGTRVDASTQVNQSGFFQMTDAFVARFAKKQLNDNLAALKKILESDQPVARAVLS
jgi:hypothetical protein